MPKTMQTAASRAVPASSPLWPLLLFKLQWWLLVLWHEHWWWLAMLLLPVQAWMLWRRQGPQSLGNAAVFAITGLLLDQSLMLAGVLRFDTTLLPLSLLLLWPAFSLALPLLPLARFTLPGLAVTGALLGAVGYGAGALVGDLRFGLAPPLALAVIAMCWALLLCCQRLWLRWRANSLVPALLAVSVLLVPMQGKADDWVTLGSARYQVLWFTLYDATLSAPTREFRFPSPTPFALTLQYHRAFSKEQIIRATLDQWRRQQLPWPADWEARLREAIPDIAATDTLELQVGDSGSGALLHNGKLVARFDDAGFVTAFAGIWLGNKTTEPGFRRRLMGAT